MSLTDTRAFLLDLFTRFDPDLDLTEGSRAESELIAPILDRIGGDPFDDDIGVFLRTRMAQVRPDLAITEVDELTDVLIDPLRVLLEPITRELQLVKLRTSLNNVAALADDEVDALMANFFESRKAGGYAVGVVRAYFAAPQNVSVTLVQVAQTKGGLRFLVTRPQAITADQMLLNIDGAEYYFDINYTAENRGIDYNIERAEVTTIANLPAAMRVTNPRPFRGGVVRESNTEYVARVQQGLSDKTLTTAPGIIGVLSDHFPELRQLYEIGYGDPEMERDIIRGGSLGAVPADDDLGAFYGLASPVDDLDADASTNVLQATGHFVTRVGAVGSAPETWYVTLSYVSKGTLIVRDAKVLEVLADNRIRVDHEMPLALATNAITWMLRQKQLTLASIPGGIALSDAAGALRLPSDTVHIGGKTDIYVAGDVETATAQVTGLSDEAPLARGFAAQTQGSSAGMEDTVLLPDIDPVLLAQLAPGMSLVLSEGTDVGAYRIVAVSTAPRAVRIDTPMTGAQSDLAWKVVDEIDVDLIAPKDVLLEGNDLILAAGSPTVIALSGINFAGAGIRDGDTLFVDDPDYGGNFTVTQSTATTLTVDPPAPRALSGVHYLVYRPSEGVERPVVRVKSLELLDSAGAPNGTVIPYRDPVLCVSKGFQNESAGFLYDGPALLGLLSSPLGGVVNVEFKTLEWEVRDPATGYAAPIAAGTFTFGPAGSASALAGQINTNLLLRNAGVRGVALTYAGQSYLGLTSQRLITLKGGTALAGLGMVAGQTNSGLRGVGAALQQLKVRRGDLVEFVSGNNTGRSARVVTELSNEGRVVLGAGPLGPPGTEALYDLIALSPDAGGRVRIARPSVGLVRCYFLQPTSVDFDYRTTRFSVTINGQKRVYLPDPENTRVVIPPPPTTQLPEGAVTNATARTLTHADTNFLSYGIRQGDLLDILYTAVRSTNALPAATPLLLGGTQLVLRLDNDPFIPIAFPYGMTPADAANYINEQVGLTIASVVDDHMLLQGSRRIEIMPSSSALGPLPFSALSSDHPASGTYVVYAVADNAITLSPGVALAGGTVTETFFRVRRFLQRVSSTEMNLNVDASGLYFADVEAVSLYPGDTNNLGSDVELEVTGYRSDGYRLVTPTPELSYSRAEELRAELSRTLLLVGAADNPIDYVQLNLQNVQVTYERSALVDDIQSFCSSRFRRVVCEDILVRHLLPHYVSLNWHYAGGAAEPEMMKAISDYLVKIEGGGELEVTALTRVLGTKQAGSIFAVDPSSPNGRTAPLILVVRHETSRAVRASLVRDIVDTVRMSTFLPDAIALRRLSSAGLR